MSDTTIVIPPQPSEPPNRSTAVLSRGTKSKQIPRLRCKFYSGIDTMLRQLSEAFDRDGDVVEVTGFPTRIFCFRNPEHIAAIFKHPDVTHSKLKRILPRVRWLMGQGGYIRSSGWKARREQVQTAFKRPYLIRYANQVPQVAHDVIEDWQVFADSRAVFDVLHQLQKLIVRASMKMFFSIDVTGTELDELREQTHFIDLNLVRQSPLWIPLPDNVRFRRYGKSVRHFMLQHVRQARQQATGNEDLMSLLVNLTDPDTKRPWSDREIVDEMCSVYFGASVMSTTLAWCLLQVAAHPSVQERLREEALNVHERRIPNSEDLSKLPFTARVLQETLRLFPPSWGFPRYTKGGMDISGYTIPSRSVVIPMICHAHQHPDYWKNPAVFQPERFESADDIHPYAYFPYGRGPRACLGKNLAPMVMRPVLSMIHARYWIEYASPLPADPVSSMGFEIHPRDKVPFRVSSN